VTYRIVPPVTWGSTRGARGPYASTRLPTLTDIDNAQPRWEPEPLYLEHTRVGRQLRDIVLLPVIGHRRPAKPVV
jgi:hypothetical protein